MHKLMLFVKWIPTVIMCSWIFYLSSVPGAVVTAMGYGNEDYHRIIHFLLYFLLCIAFFIGSKNIEYALLFCVFYSVTDEIHQLFVPMRSASIFDIFVDSLGAVTASVILWKLYPLLYKKLKILLKR